MSESSDEKPKKIRAKVDVKLLEHCIYKADDRDLLFNVRVTKRINGKQHVKFKRNVKGTTRARQTRTQFINELEVLSQEILEGNLLWPKAVEKYFLTRESQVAASTFKTQKSEINAHTSSWSEMRLRDFNASFIEKDLKKSTAGLEKTTVKSILKHIRAVFEFYVGNSSVEYPLERNPCKGIQAWGEKPKEGKQKRLPKMTEVDIDRLLEYTQETDPTWYYIFATAYFTGMRSGELFGLRWQNIDDDFKKITVTHSYCFVSKQLKAPKNEDARTVPISDELRVLFKKLKLISKSEYVLPHPPMWRDGKIAQQLNVFQNDLGIPKTSFHSIRASYITHMLMAGVSIAKVMASAGHSMLSTTVRYVRRVDEEDSYESITDVLSRRKPDKNTVLPFRKKTKKG